MLLLPACVPGFVLPTWRPSSTPSLRLTAVRASAVEEKIVDVAIAAGREAADVVVARVGADVLKTKASRGDLLTAADAEVQDLIERRVAEAFPSHAFLGEESVDAGAAASASALGSSLDGSAEYLWICDPIDGTTNFVQSLPLVGISIGVAKREASGYELCAGVIVDPFRGEIFAARRGAGATLDGEPIRVGPEALSDAVVATGFAPTQASLQPMLRGMAEVGRKARTLRMLGSAAIMLAWVACGRLSAYFEADLNSWDSAAGVLLVREAGGAVTGLDGARHQIETRTLIASNQACHSELQVALAAAGVQGLDAIESGV